LEPISRKTNCCVGKPSTLLNASTPHANVKPTRCYNFLITEIYGRPLLIVRDLHYCKQLRKSEEVIWVLEMIIRLSRNVDHQLFSYATRNCETGSTTTLLRKFNTSEYKFKFICHCIVTSCNIVLSDLC
jgi:hypothetical protein